MCITIDTLSHPTIIYIYIFLQNLKLAIVVILLIVLPFVEILNELISFRKLIFIRISGEFQIFYIFHMYFN